MGLLLSGKEHSFSYSWVDTHHSFLNVHEFVHVLTMLLLKEDIVSNFLRLLNLLLLSRPGKQRRLNIPVLCLECSLEGNHCFQRSQFRFFWSCNWKKKNLGPLQIGGFFWPHCTSYSLSDGVGYCSLVQEFSKILASTLNRLIQKWEGFAGSPVIFLMRSPRPPPIIRCKVVA